MISGWPRRVIPSPGAVWPARVMLGRLIFSGLAADVEDHGAWAPGLDGGPQAARSRIVEGGDMKNRAAAASRGETSESLGARKGDERGRGGHRGRRDGAGGGKGQNGERLVEQGKPRFWRHELNTMFARGEKVMILWREWLVSRTEVTLSIAMIPVSNRLPL